MHSCSASVYVLFTINKVTDVIQLLSYWSEIVKEQTVVVDFCC